jgi:hypothetical protein
MRIKYLPKTSNEMANAMPNLIKMNSDGEQSCNPNFVKRKVAPQINVTENNISSAFQGFNHHLTLL